MRKLANILLFVLIAALLPLRSMAATMTDSCAAAHEQPAAHPAADVHCPGLVVVLPAAAPAPVYARAAECGIAFVEPAAPSFFPDPLDPPPLGLPA
ncbi:MAG TPA: hypothetical protein VFO82_08180 [Steroidobacteraceae bacterium]|jgi:hypothetical protein|nr:hypothetical protein [Steroidobacteraceae bacterium]HSA69477.1 hypothetical protein [Burkholderiales bacterium]